jgi:DNA-binding transcriptional LysR family regulator
MQEFLRNLPRMAVFASVVEHGSFTAASEQLNLGKSVLSQHVSELERQLGVRLLHRTTRRLRLTEAGSEVYRHCRALLDQAELARDAAARQQAEPSGLIRIAAPTDFGHRHLMPVLGAFCARHVGIRSELLLDEQPIDLIGERIDLAIRVGELADSRLVSRPLTRIRRVLCASPGYLASAAPIRTLADLPGQRWSLLGHQARDAELTFFASDGSSQRLRIKPHHAANSAHGLRSLILHDQGLAVMPEDVIGDDLRAGRLIEVLPEQQLAVYAVNLLYPSARGLPSRVRALIDALLAAIPKQIGSVASAD